MGKYEGETTEDFVFIIQLVDGIFAELMDGGDPHHHTNLHVRIQIQTVTHLFLCAF
jgi:hypothetical protein